ncbi:AMP-binding protein [Demequina activiva]|nr:AMP-binding protein [Demequina activiva]
MDYARLVDAGADAIDHALAGRARGVAARTSGSTGEPREVLLSADAVVASARATLERLGGAGHWLLALPTDRIAGAMVVARARVGGGAVVETAAGRFTPEGFAAAASRMPQGRRYVSLVPTQVRRLLASPEGSEALARFDAVLVGGAPPGMALPSNAVETYGMTETCGGCVYDGAPLSAVGATTDAQGRILLAGPTLADGYADGDDGAFVERDGERWFLTSDLGAWDGSRLAVHGRADDVIISGGLNVHPAAVERALLTVPGIVDAVVVGVPDAEWGERVAALVVSASEGVPDVDALRGMLDVPGHAMPRFILARDAVPRTDAGKIDRSTARAIVARAAEEAP